MCPKCVFQGSFVFTTFWQRDECFYYSVDSKTPQTGNSLTSSANLERSSTRGPLELSFDSCFVWHHAVALWIARY